MTEKQESDSSLTTQEKTIFISVFTISMGGFLIGSIAKKGSKFVDRIKLLGIGLAVSILLGVLSVLVPRLIFGKPTKKGIQQTDTFQSIKDKFSSIGKKPETTPQPSDIPPAPPAPATPVS